MVMVVVVMMVTMVSIILGGGKRSGESLKEGICWALVKKLNEGQRAHMVERGGKSSVWERGGFSEAVSAFDRPKPTTEGRAQQTPTFPTSSWLLLFVMLLLCVVQSLSCVWLCVTPRTQQTRLPCPSLSPGVCSPHSRPLFQWCHPTISSSVAPFSSCPQSFPASESFPMSWLFESGSQIIGDSVSASVLPVNVQGWFLLGLTGLISLQSKGLSRVFSSTAIQKHQVFDA